MRPLAERRPRGPPAPPATGTTEERPSTIRQTRYQGDLRKICIYVFINVVTMEKTVKGERKVGQRREGTPLRN